MSNENPSTLSDALALRGGALGIYLLVGMIAGLAVGAVVLYSDMDRAFSFAKYVFGTSALCALMAFAFPNSALQALSVLAHFTYGLVQGATAPDSWPSSDPRATTMHVLAFWSGVGLVLCLWLAWLLL